jgi:hypothetical protein
MITLIGIVGILTIVGTIDMWNQIKRIPNV